MMYFLTQHTRAGTEKSLNFMGTKFRGLMMMDIFVDTWIRWVQTTHNITKVNKYFCGTLNSLNRLPWRQKKTNTKLNVQQIKKILPLRAWPAPWRSRRAASRSRCRSASRCGGGQTAALSLQWRNEGIRMLELLFNAPTNADKACYVKQCMCTLPAMQKYSVSWLAKMTLCIMTLHLLLYQMSFQMVWQTCCR